jgi:predicted secreted protein
MPANTPTRAKIGKGARLACQFDGVTYTDVAEVVTVPFPNLVADDVEVTNQDSPGLSKEYISGLTEPGEMTASCNWIPDDATQDHIAGILHLKQTGEVVSWKITTPDAVLTCTVDGYVKSFTPTIPIGEEMTMEFVVKVAGDPVFS